MFILSLYSFIKRVLLIWYFSPFPQIYHLNDCICVFCSPLAILAVSFIMALNTTGKRTLVSLHYLFQTILILILFLHNLYNHCTLVSLILYVILILYSILLLEQMPPGRRKGKWSSLMDDMNLGCSTIVTESGDVSFGKKPILKYIHVWQFSYYHHIQNRCYAVVFHLKNI